MSKAQLIDERPEEEVNDTDVIEQQEDFESQEEVAQPSEVPEKYLNKSLEEVVHMHQEAEKLLGKQSSEVGDLRKIVDEHIQAQPHNKQAPEQQQEDDTDFFVDPANCCKQSNR